ncbi:DUF378 domain-containing protein [Simkania sp.]|uniref:DUF378 domain-containing protein n=1 Tax=Simkania sp. TaxID=34094 RepID=UPI003B525751
MKVISVIALILILIGALNWGLWGFFQFDFVAWLFGGDSTWLARLVYALVGLSGLWGLSFLAKCKYLCGSCCKK